MTGLGIQLARKVDTSFISNEYSVGVDLENRVLYNSCASQVIEKYLDSPLSQFALQSAVVYLDAYPEIRVFKGFQTQIDPFLCLIAENDDVIQAKNPEMTMFGILLRSLGATIVTTLSKHTSHIVVSRKTGRDRFHALTSLIRRTESKFSKRPWIVSDDWAQDCFDEQTWLDELKYNH